MYLKDTRNLAPATINTYLAPIRHFYDINELELKWKKINRFKGEHHEVVEDQPYTRDQIKQLLDKAEQRNRAIILLLCSSGIRVGAVPGIRIGDLKPIDKYNIYQIEIYKRSRSKYITFCSSECRREIDIYLKYRERYGEKLTKDSPLFRKAFNRTDEIQVRNPQPLTTDSIKWFVNELLNATGVRPSAKMLEGQTHNKRTNLMQLHGFRKFFDTTCTSAGMSSLYTELLMGHDIGLKGRYTKLTPEQLLEGNDKNIGYISAMEQLTIYEENRLRRENETLKVNKSEIDQLKERVEQYEDFMATFNPQIEEFQREISNLKNQINEETEKKKNKQKNGSSNK